MAKLIMPTGEVLDSIPANGQAFTLQELYALLDCQTIEIIRPAVENLLMVIDEDGKMKNLPWNATATSIFREAGGATWDHIVGPALVGTTEEID